MSRRTIETILIQVALVGVVASLVMVAGKLRYGSVSAAVASARGYSLFCENPEEHLGDILAGTPGKTTFRFRNVIDIPIKIAGAELSCDCVTLSEFPIIVDPYSVATIDVQLHVDESDIGQPVSSEFLVFINVPNPEMICRVSGNAVSEAREVTSP